MKIGFIGFGNMASAIGKALINFSQVKAEDIYISNKTRESSKKWADELGVIPLKSNLELVNLSDIIFLGVKPYYLKDLLNELGSSLDGKIIISIVAGLSNKKLKKLLPKSQFISIIPNIPVEVGQGIFIVEEGYKLESDWEKEIFKLLEPLGLIQLVDKDLMDIYSTIAGCCPAYIAILIEALADVGLKYGMTRKDAYMISSKMIQGTSSYLLNSQIHPAILKDRVSSPKGTTIKGVTALEEYGFRNSIIKAIEAVIED